MHGDVDDVTDDAGLIFVVEVDRFEQADAEGRGGEREQHHRGEEQASGWDRVACHESGAKGWKEVNRSAAQKSPRTGMRGLVRGRVGCGAARSGSAPRQLFSAAWAAASRAMGTRKGEQLT